jgi:non-heme chloroperoxidase
MNASTAMGAAALSEGEAQQVEAANASGQTPVVFIHGLWLLSSSWERWADLFEAAGYPAVLAEWPGELPTVERARANPDSQAGKGVGEAADRIAGVIGALDRKPAIVGHSFGGALTQILAGRGLAAASVAIGPAPVRGVLPVPVSTLRSILPVVRNPANRKRAVSLDFEQWRYVFGNALAEGEARGLYETFAVAAPGLPLFEAATANLNPFTALKADARTDARGPLLIIAGAEDHATPPTLANAAYKRQRRNGAVTEIARIDNRGHSLTIDSGWREVAESALEFVRRFA